MHAYLVWFLKFEIVAVTVKQHGPMHLNLQEDELKANVEALAKFLQDEIVQAEYHIDAALAGVVKESNSQCAPPSPPPPPPPNQSCMLSKEHLHTFMYPDAPAACKPAYTVGARRSPLQPRRRPDPEPAPAEIPVCL